LDPTNALLYLGRGVTYEHLSQYEQAIRDFDEAIRLNPNLTEASTDRQDAQARMSATTANENAALAKSDSVVSNPDVNPTSIFNNNFLNTGLWSVTVVPAGVGTISENNQQLEMTKTESGNGYMGLASKCKVEGDFDVQVDYKLLNWPAQNFHTVRLMASDLPDGGTGFPGVYRNSNADEDYQFRNQLGSAGFFSVPTADMAATIGLKRIGQTLFGYISHVTIGSAPAPISPTGFTIDFAASSATAPPN